MNQFRCYKVVLLCVATVWLAATGCKQVALFERLENIPDGQWSSAYVPMFDFDISDTTSGHQVFVVVRHTNRYPYRNIWLEVGIQQPGDSMRLQQFELTLAGPDQWLGTGMDDIFERRVSLFKSPVVFNKPGRVHLQLRQTMRLDPLPEILQAGIRIEPVPGQ